jgi:hypothetical protein
MLQVVYQGSLCSQRGVIVIGAHSPTLLVYLSPFLLSSLLGVTYYPKNSLSWG